jgi:hypothetical protein
MTIKKLGILSFHIILFHLNQKSDHGNFVFSHVWSAEYLITTPAPRNTLSPLPNPLHLLHSTDYSTVHYSPVHCIE